MTVWIPVDDDDWPDVDLTMRGFEAKTGTRMWVCYDEDDSGWGEFGPEQICNPQHDARCGWTWLIKEPA